MPAITRLERDARAEKDASTHAQQIAREQELVQRYQGKPLRSAYARALDRIGRSPGEVLFADDLLEYLLPFRENEQVRAVIQTRAFENQVFVAYINHHGSDPLFSFAGLSPGILLTPVPLVPSPKSHR